jgi:hypothetical protein
MPGGVLRKFQVFRSVANMGLWQKMVKFDKKLRLIAIFSARLVVIALMYLGSGFRDPHVNQELVP